MKGLQMDALQELRAELCCEAGACMQDGQQNQCSARFLCLQAPLKLSAGIIPQKIEGCNAAMVCRRGHQAGTSEGIEALRAAIKWRMAGDSRPAAPATSAGSKTGRHSCSRRSAA